LALTSSSEIPRQGRRVQAALQSAAEPAARLPRPVVLYLASVLLPVLFNAGSLALSLQRVFLLVMVVPLTVNLLRGRYGRLMWTDVLFFLHIGWATVALAVNNPDRVIQNMGSTSIEFLGGYLIGRAYIRNAEDFIAFARLFVFLVLCTVPLALHEAVTGRPVIIEMIRSLPGVTSVGIVNIDPRMGLERVQALFAHPIHYGLFCGTAFSLAFVGLRGILSDTMRYLMSAAIGLCVFLSLSSGALLPLVLQIGLILWAGALRSVRQRWLILLGLFMLAYVAIDLFSNRTPIKVFMSYATFSAHNAYWRGLIFEWGMVNVRANPVFGIGLNDWVRPFFMRSGSMDNFWLVNAVRYGIPGFVLLALGYLPALWWIGRRDLDADRRLWQIRRAWMFTFFGLTMTLCTVHVWTAVYSFVFFVFGAGMWLLRAEPATASPGTSPDTSPGTSRAGPGLRRDRPAPIAAADTPANTPADRRGPDRAEGPSLTRFPATPRPGAGKVR